MGAVVRRPWGGWRSQRELVELARNAECARTWSCDGVTTVKVRGRRTGRWVTWRRRFAPPEVLEELGAELAEAGYELKASSWTGVWRPFAPHPAATPASVARTLALAGRRPHAWEEQTPGLYDGAWRSWDLSGAYPWAAAQGLPDMRTARRADPKRDGISDDGYYLVDGLDRPGPETWRLPTWLRDPDEDAWSDESDPELADAIEELRPPERRCWVPGQVLNAWNLGGRVVAGVEWEWRVDFRRTFERIREATPTYWRRCLSTSWGDWTGARVEYCRWEGGRIVRRSIMPRGLSCPLWADLTQARVACKVSRLAEHAVRVYVDSVTVPAEVTPSRIGRELGEWRLEREYPQGVEIPVHPFKPRRRFRDIVSGRARASALG